MAISLVIFDLDGTLIDSVADICAAVNYGLEPYGLAPVTVEETRASVGEGVSMLIAKLLAMKGTASADKDEIVKRTLDYYAAHLVAFTTIYPEVRETLDALASIRKAIVSNKVTSLAEGIVRALDLSKYFDLVAGSDSAPERKPSPVPILKVLSLLRMPAHETLLVGDSLYDMMAGRAAGVKTVAVTYGYGQPGFSDGADYVIDRFSQLFDLVS